MVGKNGSGVLEYGFYVEFFNTYNSIYVVHSCSRDTCPISPTATPLPRG